MGRYESLAGMDKVDKDDSVKLVSVFQDNYRYARVCLGKDHTSARNWAIDYHRRFTAREMTDHWDETKHTIEDDNAVQALDLILLNQLVDRLFENGSEQDRKFLLCVCRMEQLEQYFNDVNLLRSVEMLGDFEPERIADIVQWMGLRARSNGTSAMVPELRKRLRELVSAFWTINGGATVRGA